MLAGEADTVLAGEGVAMIAGGEAVCPGLGCVGAGVALGDVP